MKPVTGRLWVGGRLLACWFAGLLAGACFAGTSAGFVSVGVALYNPGFVPPLLPPWAGLSVSSGVSPGGAASVFGVPVAGAPVAAAVLRPGGCISEALGRQAQALVRVACGGGQFVSIAPMPGKPFLGTHGGAFRYTFGAGSAATVLASGAGVAYLGAGALTALRVFSANEPDGLLELLVSF